jgi:hypothetical protein
MNATTHFKLPDAYGTRCNHTWHKHPPHCATKDGLAHSNNCIRRKMPNITPLVMRFDILLSLLRSSAQIFSSVQKRNTRRPIELRGPVIIMRDVPVLNLSPNTNHTAISVDSSYSYPNKCWYSNSYQNPTISLHIL